jgi:hypothetical protein
MKPFVKDAGLVMLLARQEPSVLGTLRQNRSSLRFEKFVDAPPFPSPQGVGVREGNLKYLFQICNPK